jgi:hypothetical protein
VSVYLGALRIGRGQAQRLAGGASLPETIRGRAFAFAQHGIRYEAK